jgi:hypothetical protein
MKSRAALLVLVVTGLSFFSTAFGQDSPSPTQVRSLLADCEYSIRRFEEITDKVDFSKWKTDSDLISAVQADLTASRQLASRTKQNMAEIRNPSRLNTTIWLMLYDAIISLDETASSLSHFLLLATRDHALATELTNFSTAMMTGPRPKLREMLWEQAVNDQLALSKCAPGN